MSITEWSHKCDFTVQVVLFSKSLQSSKWCSLFSVTLSSYPPVRTTKKYCINRDCSMESGHKPLLLTSCNASNVQTSERSKQVNFWCITTSEWKSFKHFPWYYVFVSYMLTFFHISKIGSKWLKIHHLSNQRHGQ